MTMTSFAISLNCQCCRRHIYQVSHICRSANPKASDTRSRNRRQKLASENWRRFLVRSSPKWPIVCRVRR